MIIKEYNDYGISFEPLEVDIDYDNMYGFKFYNAMTDDNFYIISQDKSAVKTYANKLIYIYTNSEDEDIDKALGDFDNEVNSHRPKVLITDPESWTDEIFWIDNERHWLLTDSDDHTYDITPIGSWSSRF